MNVLPYTPWFPAGLALVLSAATLLLLARGHHRLPQAHPSQRSLHDRPVSRVGGLAIWAGFLPVALLAPIVGVGGTLWIWAWIAVVAVSLADDWWGVHAAVRLAVHALAAFAVSATFLGQGVADPALVPTLTMVAVALTFTLGIVWSANLFNFMDGNDGLAAVMAICGFGAYGVAALQAGATADPYFALAAATVPFLAVNAPPARTFMGDSGSVGLGFLAGVFGFAGVRALAWPEWFPLLVFLPFIADATVTVIRRIAAGEHVFEAHNGHYYQRLHRMGLGHEGTLLFFGVLIVGTTASALFTLATAPDAGWRVFGAWVLVIGVLFAGIDYHWRGRSP